MASTRIIVPDIPEFRFPRGLRSPGSSSDVMSASGRSFVGGVPAANPRPLFVAQSAAETLASAELDMPVVVNEAALDLVNSFLDQTLYSLLSLSKSTSIGSIRLAVPKLLKPRLGQAALRAGDEEVRDILDARDFGQNQVPSSKVKPSEFDLELVWKLARLRCMVYSRLGDLEEEDEEDILEQEDLSEHMQNPKTSTTPLEALFLAAILGFLGEQALCTAAQHAERRHVNLAASRSMDETESEEENEEELVLEPVDMLQLGREGPLSRLWRSWRRDTRSVEAGPSRPGSRGYPFPTTPGDSFHARKASLPSKESAIPEEETPNANTPSQIPLPMRDNDVDEIEVPGLAPLLDGEQERSVQIPERSARRPSSALLTPVRHDQSGTTSPTYRDYPERSPRRPQPSRTRSRSLPTPDQTRFPTSYRHQNQDTTVFSPDNTQHTDSSDREDSIHELPDNQRRSGDEKANEENSPHRPNNVKASIMSGTVAAIAGALGVEAMKQSRTSKEQQDQSIKTPQYGDQPKRTRTVVEEIMGPENHVAPPTDAETGSSITGRSDFDSIYIPANAADGGRSKSHGVDGASSDPEDLALSSADEENIHHDRPHVAHELPAGAFRVSPQPNNRATERNVPVSQPSSPSSPRWAKCEAAVYENHVIPMRSNGDDAGHGEPGPAQLADENRQSLGIPIQQHAPVTPSFPQRGSSREQPGKQHVPTESKSSEYSQHSPQSGSSSSGKVFVYGKDQYGRPQNMTQQRAAFVEPPQTGHSRNLSKEQNQSGNIASRRGRLRLSTDEDTRIDEEKKKSLEILIQSDETLHYTLTPESARAAEIASSGGKPKTVTQDLADFIRNTAPPGDQQVRPLTSRQNVNGLRSNPPEDAPAPPIVPSANTPPSPSQGRNLNAPRDARPQPNTTRDLADYVRSTGPASEQQLAQALGTRPGLGSRPGTGNVSLHGGVRPDGVPVAPVGNSSLDSTRPSTNSDRPVNRLKFQARDARPARNTETSELIDFIREGPPRVAGDHRIGRHVAPFRTTMDSEDLEALAPPPEVAGRGSVGSAPESAVTAKSVQESTNSRTALLDSTNRGTGRQVNAFASGANEAPRQAATGQNGMPPRTRRRVRDPYEIDGSDDELEAELFPPKPAKQEESLIDFLRNTAPPPGMAPQPIMAAAPRTDNKPDVKRTASNSKLKDVLTRQGSVANKQLGKNSPNGAREESPHLTQVGSKLDKYRPTQTTHAAHVDRNRQRPKGPEAREPTNNNTGTADLADYLKNTGPPEPPRQEQQMPTKDQAGFLKFFSRRASVRR